MIWWVSTHKHAFSAYWGQHTRFDPADKKTTVTPKTSQSEKANLWRFLNIFFILLTPVDTALKTPVFISCNHKFLLMMLNV